MTDLFTTAEKPALAPEPITVSQVSKRIHDLLDGRIARVDVIGQMNRPNLGKHWYFTLTDGDSKIDCAMWASSVSKHKSERNGWMPKQGDQVIVCGNVGHYAKFGKTQIYVEQIKPVGETKGKLQLEYEALIKEFRLAGWFDEEHKKQLPQYPNRIAVITSGTSAAMHDVVETTRRRMPSVELLIVHATMQGDDSPDSVREAIRKVDANAKPMGIDAIIVTRGGGGLEELWSFNDRRVVEAAFHCNTPIVVAIGHESDTTIIELVADHRASTPTQAAMVLVPDKDELLQMVEHYEVRLQSLMASDLERKSTWVEHTNAKVQLSISSFLHTLALRLAKQVEQLIAKRPHALLQARQRTLLTLHSEFAAKTAKNIGDRVRRIDALHTRLDSIGPMEVLKRGYSRLQDTSGEVIRSVKEVKEGDQIQTILADGTIESEVRCVHE